MRNISTIFNFKSPILGILFFMLYSNLLASDWVRLSVLNDRILVLQFDDGYIEHGGYRQGQNASVTHDFPLDISKASLLESYKIFSHDDMEFAAGISPTKINRKTKGKDFSNDCNWVNSICDNEYINQHFIYLHLPFKLKQGFTYEIELGQLAENLNRDTFVFDFRKSRSEAVHANQIGFKTSAPVKYAYLSHWMGDGGPLDLDSYSGVAFYLVDQQSGEMVFQGTIQKRLDLDNPTYIDLQRTPQQGFLSMSDVWECDFSDFNVSGEYILAIEGIGSSFPFRLDEDIYREPYYHAIRQLYHQRSGIPLESQFTDWTRPRNLHPDDRQIRFQYTTSRWMDWLSTSPENGRKEDVYAGVLPGYKLETWGWYMDAGDWDGYYNHLKIPRFLMTAFELAPENFTDGELNIPESGNGIPDILDEARFLIDYLDRTRGPKGGIAGARIHPDFEIKTVDNIPSWEDVRVWTISGEDHVTTFTFSGLAAQLAYCYGLLEMEDKMVEMLEKAVQAYEWATENFDPNVDNHHNARMYAAAWLYKLTGEITYQETYIGDFNNPSNLRYADDNRDFAIWAFLTSSNEDIDPSAKEISLNFAAQRTINEYVATAENRSFRVGFGPNFRTFLGQATTPLVFPALVLYHITGDQRYYRAALTSADYVLGGNPLDMTWMVGLGHQSPKQILHLDTWLHPDGRQEFVSGTIPYGPTSYGDGWPPNNGPWSSDFAWERIYPNRNQWPLHEGFFNNRYAVPTNEYTVHQTSAPAAAVFALLSSKSTGDFRPNQAPIVSLKLPENMEVGGSALLKVDAMDPDGYVIRVEYFYGKQKIGQSFEAPFSFIWKNIPEIENEITAIATDNQGKKSGAGDFPKIRLEGFILSEDYVELDYDGIKRVNVLEYIPENAMIKRLVWESENKDIATVDQEGLIRAQDEGMTKIRVRSLENPELKASIEVKVNSLILGNNESKEGPVVYFPNPVKDGKMNLRLPLFSRTIDFEIVDTQGKSLMKGNIGPNERQPQIDLSSFSRGMYILVMEAEFGVQHLKVLVN